MKHVLVIGGGPTGIAVAISLVHGGYAVTVVEQGHYHHFRAGEHLTPEGISLLTQLKVPLPTWESQHRLCYGVRSAWGTAYPEYRDYLFHVEGRGLNLSRPNFDRDLARFAQDQGVVLHLHSRVSQADFKDGCWSIMIIRNGIHLHLETDFVVDASGRIAVFSRTQGSQRLRHDKQMALIVLLQSSRRQPCYTEDTLVIEAEEQGWWYFARLADRQAVVMWITDSDLLHQRVRSPWSTWRERLSHTRLVSRLTQAFSQVQTKQMCSAHTQILDKVAGPGWFALGDAAMSFDPLSSQGISKGLASGPLAAEWINRYFHHADSAIDAYQQLNVHRFHDYLQTRMNYYRLEQRWPNAPFWQRRQEYAPNLVSGVNALIQQA